MAVKLRLSRVGNKNNPVYRLVATDSRSARDSKSLETLGTYHADSHRITAFAPERVSYWLSQGAIPTDSFKKISKLYAKQQAATQAPASAQVEAAQ